MIEVHANLRNVEEASALQRRLYRAVRETMRAMAGRVSGVGHWPAKKMLARHIWIDAEHADAIRERVFELRFPRVDADIAIDTALLQVLAKLPSTNSDAEFLSGVYRVVKPAILEAAQFYLKGSDPIDDAPSHRIFRIVQRELEDEIREFEKIWDELPEQERRESQAWQNWVRDALAQAGGLKGDDSGWPPLERAGFSDRPRYEIALMPKRDPRWLPAVTQVPPRPPRSPEEQQIWVAVDHVNEVWASEITAALIWMYEEMPWELYHGAARWSYDEIRHAMMGERRLQAYGIEVGVDVPMVPDHWVGIASRHGLTAMVHALHGLEQKGPHWKRELKERLWKMGDPYSSQDCDYDWADERIHLRYGKQWIEATFADLPKQELIERTNYYVNDWMEWIAEKHRSGQHGYEKFLLRIEAKVAQMPKLGNREEFVPIGSSAATKAYETAA